MIKVKMAGAIKMMRRILKRFVGKKVHQGPLNSFRLTLKKFNLNEPTGPKLHSAGKRTKSTLPKKQLHA